MSAPKVRRRLQAAAFGLVVLVSLALYGLLSPRPVPRYTVTDLGVLPNDGQSSASSINNEGDIVGVSGPGGIGLRHAFLYQDGMMTDLGKFGLVNLHDGPLINDSSQVTGVQVVMGVPGRKFHASLYSKGATHDLGTLPGCSSSVGGGINAVGEVVGTTWGNQPGNWTSTERGFLYSGGRMTGIGALLGYSNVMPTGINAGGQIVGCSWQSGRKQLAFVYDSRTRKMTALATPSGFRYGVALGINDHAHIIGSLIQSDRREQAVIWANGQATVLKLIPGRGSAEGGGINNRGEAVGATWAVPSALSQIVSDHPIRLRPLLPLFDLHQIGHAFVYQNGKMQDLNELVPADSGWTLEYARAINDRGQIVGAGPISRPGTGLFADADPLTRAA